MKFVFLIFAFTLLWSAPCLLAEGQTIASVTYRADFTIRNRRFAALVEKEVNSQAFRKKLSHAIDIPLASALKPKATLQYKPFEYEKRGGFLTARFADEKSELSMENLERLWKRVEVYIVERFKGEKIQDAEDWACNALSVAARAQ